MKKTLLISVLALACAQAYAVESNSDNQQIKANRGTSYHVTDSVNEFADPNAYKSTSFSFPIAAQQALDFSKKPSKVRSKQFMMEVDGATLKKGIDLQLAGKGALVRISTSNESNAVNPYEISVIKKINGEKRVLAKGIALDTVVEPQAMQKTGMGFAKGTTGFKFSDELESGVITLKSESAIADKAIYLVNVFDKQSATELQLTANKSNFLSKDSLRVEARGFTNKRNSNIQTIEGKIVSPSGMTFDVNFRQSGSGYDVDMPLTMNDDLVHGALWELQTSVEIEVDGQTLKRNARIPFAYSRKTAKMDRTTSIVNTGEMLEASIAVQAFEAGRFEVRGVLYGTNAKGKLIPVMMTHSAATMDSGDGMILMQFDQKILEQSGVQAPFELRNLSLRDQKRRAILD